MNWYPFDPEDFTTWPIKDDSYLTYTSPEVIDGCPYRILPWDAEYNQFQMRAKPTFWTFLYEPCEENIIK